MIVQIDETGDNKSIACIDYRRACKTGGGGRISCGDGFHEAVVSEVNAAGEHSRRICAAHRNNAAGDYKRHRCLRFLLYLRVASVRTEIAGGPQNSLYVSVWRRCEKRVVVVVVLRMKDF